MSAPIIIGTIGSACVDGGDAAEMQTRLRSLFVLAAGLNLFLADVSLAGTGDGPRWLTQISTTSDSNTSTLAAFSSLFVFVVQAGDPEELQFKILQQLSVFPTFNYVAIETAGAGSGRDYMAVIVIQPTEIL